MRGDRGAIYFVAERFFKEEREIGKGRGGERVKSYIKYYR